MDKETDQKNINQFSWKRLIIIVLFVLFSATTVCGLIYWKLNEVVKIQDEQINSLTNQIDATSEKINQLSPE